MNQTNDHAGRLWKMAERKTMKGGGVFGEREGWKGRGSRGVASKRV